MPRPDPLKLQLPPGVCLTTTDYAAMGRYVEAEGVRWVAGKFEKRGGWTKWIDDQLSGRPGAMHAWRDLSLFRRMAVATNKKLYAVLGGELANITPWSPAATTTLAGAITTSNGSTSVTIAFTAHGQQVGDQVRITGADEVGGVLLEGPYVVATVPDANTITVVHAFAATANAGPTGGLTIETYRGKLSNPFSTTSGSATVSVADTAHGRGLGDTVTFDNASAVGGITIDGDYTVSRVVDSDNYEITHSSAASSTAGPGGGATVYFWYEIPIGPDTSAPAFGYGAGTYGAGTWGTPRATSITIEARTWTLDSDRDVLIAGYGGGALYEWIPDTSVRATPIPNAPTMVQAHFVSEERAVHALGITNGPTTDQWSNLGDRYNWTPAEDSDSRSEEVQSPQGFIAGVRFRGQMGVAWTRLAPWIVQFTSDDFVYDLRQMAGTGGIAGKHAYAMLDGALYWMGPSSFSKFDGSAYGEIDMRDVAQFVFNDINLAQGDKFATMVDERFGEICFQYCSAASSEIDRWVAIYPREGRAIAGMTCGYGTNPLRTAWADKGVFDSPIGASVDGYLYEHDAPGIVDADGASLPWRVRTGLFEVLEGARSGDVMYVIPDFERIAGEIEMTIYSREYPQSTEEANGPWTLTGTTEIEDLDPRVNGRLCALELSADAIGSDVRVGLFQFGVQPAGER